MNSFEQKFQSQNSRASAKTEQNEPKRPKPGKMGSPRKCAKWSIEPAKVRVGKCKSARENIFAATSETRSDKQNHRLLSACFGRTDRNDPNRAEVKKLGALANRRTQLRARPQKCSFGSFDQFWQNCSGAIRNGRFGRNTL